MLVAVKIGNLQKHEIFIRYLLFLRKKPLPLQANFEEKNIQKKHKCQRYSS